MVIASMSISLPTVERHIEFKPRFKPSGVALSLDILITSQRTNDSNSLYAECLNLILDGAVNTVQPQLSEHVQVQ